MTYETKQAYSEVCAVLDNMPNEYVSKIPKKIIDLFQAEKLKDYKPNINTSNPLDKNYLGKKTMVLIAMLNYYYWCPNKEIKDDLYKMYLNNNEKYEKEIAEMYDTNNLFKNSKAKKVAEQDEEQEVALVKYNEGNFLTRLFNRIKRFFSRNKE